LKHDNIENHYRKFQKIGNGRFGNVSTAVCVNTGAKMAIKTLVAEYSEATREIAREV
jgi:serine/threonine protein kinase